MVECLLFWYYIIYARGLGFNSLWVHNYFLTTWLDQVTCIITWHHGQLPNRSVSLSDAWGFLGNLLKVIHHISCYRCLARLQGSNSLQIHVLPSPAYDILLGRPFDVLTESVIRNYRDMSQTITIHDPNTGNICVIPTHERRRPQFISGARSSPKPPNEQSF